MIAPYAELNLAAVRRIAIADDQSALLALPQEFDFVPVYADAGIRGAIRTCYLREAVIARLAQAGKNVAKSGYTLQVLDGWRPPAVQQALYDDIFRQLTLRHPEDNEAERHHRTRHFVSQPSILPERPSAHLTGGAVDVTLTRDGVAVDMGSGFDEPSHRSYTDAFEKGDSTIRERRRVLYHAMLDAGFTNLPSEWWHYDFGNQNWAYCSGKAQAHFGLAWPDGWGDKT